MTPTTIYTIKGVSVLLQLEEEVVQCWFDAHWLKGYLRPETRDPRIPVEHLATFIESAGHYGPEGWASLGLVWYDGKSGEAVRILWEDVRSVLTGGLEEAKRDINAASFRHRGQ